MEYETRTKSGVAILNLRGEIDVSCAPNLRETMMDLIERNKGQLLVNLGDVVYMDSAGLSVLIAAHRQAQKVDGVLGLCSPQQPVRQVLNITGVDKFIPLFSNVEEGVNALRKTDYP